MGVQADWGGVTSQVLGLPQGAGRPAGRRPGNATGLNLGRLRFARIFLTLTTLTTAPCSSHSEAACEDPAGAGLGSPGGRPSHAGLAPWARLRPWAGTGREVPCGRALAVTPGFLGSSSFHPRGAEKHAQRLGLPGCGAALPRPAGGLETPTPSQRRRPAAGRPSLTWAAPPLSGSKGLDPHPRAARGEKPQGPEGDPGAGSAGPQTWTTPGVPLLPTAPPGSGRRPRGGSRGRGEPGARREAGPAPAVPAALAVSPSARLPPPETSHRPAALPSALQVPRPRLRTALPPAPSLRAPRPERSHHWNNCYRWAGRRAARRPRAGPRAGRNGGAGGYFDLCFKKFHWTIMVTPLENSLKKKKDLLLLLESRYFLHCF